MNKLICHQCKKEIKEEDKYTSLETSQGIKNKKKISEYMFHLDCWTEFVNLSIQKILKEAQKQASSIINNTNFLKED